MNQSEMKRKKLFCKNNKNKIIYQFRSKRPIRPANDLFGRMYKPILKFTTNLRALHVAAHTQQCARWCSLCVCVLCLRRRPSAVVVDGNIYYFTLYCWRRRRPLFRSMLRGTTLLVSVCVRQCVWMHCRACRTTPRFRDRKRETIYGA